MFLAVKKCPSSDHIYHAFHHKLATKTPRKNTTISQNPLQKHTPHHAGKKENRWADPTVQPP
jgi:hypothetical protein